MTLFLYETSEKYVGEQYGRVPCVLGRVEWCIFRQRSTRSRTWACSKPCSIGIKVLEADMGINTSMSQGVLWIQFETWACCRVCSEKIYKITILSYNHSMNGYILSLIDCVPSWRVPTLLYIYTSPICWHNDQNVSFLLLVVSLLTAC